MNERFVGPIEVPNPNGESPSSTSFPAPPTTQFECRVCFGCDLDGLTAAPFTVADGETICTACVQEIISKASEHGGGTP